MMKALRTVVLLGAAYALVAVGCSTPTPERQVAQTSELNQPTSKPPPATTTGIPSGSFEYIYSPQEADRLIAVGFSEGEAAAAGYPAVVALVLLFEDGQWEQYFTFDGKPFLVDGEPEGDHGSFDVNGDQLALHSTPAETTTTFRWSLDGDTLSLRDGKGGIDAADLEVTRLVFEHDLVRVS